MGEATYPAILEGKLMGLGLDRDGKVRVKNFGAGYYTKCL